MQSSEWVSHSLSRRTYGCGGAAKQRVFGWCVNSRRQLAVFIDRELEFAVEYRRVIMTLFELVLEVLQISFDASAEIATQIVLYFFFSLV